MDSKKGADLERYKEIVKERNYAAQAKFWLNAYWPEYSPSTAFSAFFSFVEIVFETVFTKFHSHCSFK
jgi:hypothetical protein